MPMEQHMQKAYAEAAERNMLILNFEFEKIKWDTTKYKTDLEEFLATIKEVEQLLVNLDSTDFYLQFKLDCKLPFELLQNLRINYSKKRAIAQYTMHYIQNLEVILQNKIKLFHLKQQHG